MKTIAANPIIIIVFILRFCCMASCYGKIYYKLLYVYMYVILYICKAEGSGHIGYKLLWPWVLYTRNTPLNHDSYIIYTLICYSGDAILIRLWRQHLSLDNYVMSANAQLVLAVASTWRWLRNGRTRSAARKTPSPLILAPRSSSVWKERTLSHPVSVLHWFHSKMWMQHRNLLFRRTPRSLQTGLSVFLHPGYPRETNAALMINAQRTFC